MPTRQPTQGITFQQIISIALFVLGIAWGVSFWWIQDQTTQTRALSKGDTEQKVKIDIIQQDASKDRVRLESVTQSFAELKASLAATEPYAAQSRALLASVASSVSKQEDDTRYLISTIDEIKKLLQIIGKDQIALRSEFKVLNDTLPVKRTK